jgi:general secretion pathway protein A
MRDACNAGSEYPWRMYASFFGLKHEPFSIAPDPRYLYMSKRHREALAHLLYGVKGGGGFVLLSGEIGAGKTTVCRCFLEQIPKRSNVAYIFNPKLTVNELLQSVCEEFRIEVPVEGREPTVKDYVDALNDYLLKTHAVGQNNILIIDEAQMLSAEVLEQLRLLTNLETNEKKLLQIVLIGQPELRAMLARPELEQLAQRVIARFHLKALSGSETLQYIRHRLSVAGLTRGMPFDRAALQRIQVLSRGVPRRINLLCDRAMLGAYSRGTHRIGRETVERAALEVFGRSEARAPATPGPQRLALLAAGIVAVVALAAWAGWWLALDRQAARTVPTASGSASTSSAARAGSSGASNVASAAPVHAASGSTGAASTSSSPQAGANAAATLLAAVGTNPPASAPAPIGGSAGVTPVVSLEAPKPLAAAELRSTFSPRDEKDAWRELATWWNLDVSNGEPCELAQRHQVRCYKAATPLELVRRLGRPGIVGLRDDANRAVHVLLVGLTDQAAILQVGGVARSATLGSFQKLWDGEFATYWRVPPGYAGSVSEGDTGPAVDYLAARLATLDGEPPPSGKQALSPALRRKVARFQTTHGLRGTGTAGPTTFMQLNRASGVDEPWLRLQQQP